MNGERWKVVNEILDAALEIAPHRRDQYLSDACAGDRALMEEVKSLITCDRRAGNFLEEPAIHLAARAAASSAGGDAFATSVAGVEIPNYRILKLLGHGGMGSVWLAERSDGRFERKVAIKFINLRMLGRSGLERFKREGSVLARMSHPHIAELIDAGVTSKEEPYLVLEYVEGQELDEYCDRHALGLEARIRLFLDVLSAVAHAHSNLVVHRDIKPSNVFVRSDGQVKLLDFGIAKLLADVEDSVSASVLTLEGGGVLTPRFAAPEQVSGGPITTATDVYTLGVLLYLLLSGQHPVGAATSSPVELVKAIVDVEPPHASDASSAGDCAERAANRATTAEKLYRELRGDLDTVISKAMKKDPAERYSSVMAMAADLNRYLNHETISARPDKVLYRLGKFIRRNRTAVLLTSTALFLVIASLSTGLIVARRQQTIAERRFTQVRQLANKYIELDEDLRVLPGSTAVRQQIVSDAQQYLSSLGSDGQPPTDLALDIALSYVRVAHVQGDPTSANLGQFPEAITNLGLATKYVDRVLARDPGNRLGLAIRCTILHDLMLIFGRQGRFDESEKQAERASDAIDQWIGDGNIQPHEVYGMAYFSINIAAVFQSRRRAGDALRSIQLADNLMTRYPKSGFSRGQIEKSYANSFFQIGELDKALSHAQKAADLEVQYLATHDQATMHVNYSSVLNLEAEILGEPDGMPSLGRSKEAFELLHKAIQIADDLASKDSGDHLSREKEASLSEDAGDLLRHGNPSEALRVYDHALARIREVKPNEEMLLHSAELLASSCYPARWTRHRQDAEQRIQHALQILTDLHRYPAEKVEPMSFEYDILRAQADHHAATGQTEKAIEEYRELLSKLMAWKLSIKGDLRDAICISRTWTALAILLRESDHDSEAASLEAQRAELWKAWKGRLADEKIILSQATTQIEPPAKHPRGTVQ